MSDIKSHSREIDEDGRETSKASGWKLSKRKQLLILFVMLILLVIVLCALLIKGKKSKPRNARNTNNSNSTRNTDRHLSLDDVLNNKYYFKTFSAEWVSDDSYLRTKFGVLREYNMDTNNTTTILTANDVKDVAYLKVKQISPDKGWILFSNNTKSLYRYSFYADYYIKNLKTNEIKKLHTPTDDGEQIRYCGWSTVGNALVFVHKCNIYYVPSVTNHTNYYPITTNGFPKKVFNGVPDWVYEEEIIASAHAIEFSSDGKYMAYVMFNATTVPFYQFTKYGPRSNVYTSIEKIAYPKPGFPNPTINIIVVDLNLTSISQQQVPSKYLIPPREISENDYYYTVMKFDEKNQVFVQWMNRAQNKTICMLYRMTNTIGYIAHENEVVNGWIEYDYVTPKFAKDGSYYITMLPRPVAGKGDFRHLAKVIVNDTKVKNNVEFLTEGAFTVHDIKCWNPDEEVVYFRSTEMSPQYRHVYSYNLTSKEKKCVSCGIIKDSDGTYCTYHCPTFSTKCSWVILVCKGPFPSKSVMFGLKTGKMIVLVTNNSTREALKKKDMPKNVYYSIKSDGFDIAVKETRPKDFDPNKKYAVLFYVYGGPNSQDVNSMYNNVRIESFLVTSYDIIVVEFDARGSGFYGYKFLYAVYRNLGYYESIDAITVAKYLQTKRYVDPTKIAIWGWSYGGYFSAAVLAMSKGVINTAVAVAPVTDWRYYDTVFTERYMGLPSKDDNLRGYENSSLLRKAKDFAGKNLFFIHGTADDNVHFQNSAQLAAALIKAKVNFRSQMYPDLDHYINSNNGHVYYLITNYLITKLTGTPLPKDTRFGRNK